MLLIFILYLAGASAAAAAVCNTDNGVRAVTGIRIGNIVLALTARQGDCASFILAKMTRATS